MESKRDLDPAILRIYNTDDVIAGENHWNKRINLLDAIKHTGCPDYKKDIRHETKSTKIVR